ncbi:unnamed protein product [Urochloa humidicola]
MMAECRAGGDCLIKLFGKTIPVPEAADAAKASGISSGSSTESDAPEISAHQEASPQPEVVDAEDPKSSPETTAAAGAGDAAGQREKLKKPDKVLPCPRCNSMDTKFCYFNNYNVNQPRHFCKNCQRYWTAGGAMRNVPVGAGRRKNKHAAAAAAAHFLQRVRAAADPPLRAHGGGTVLSFAAHGAPPPGLHDLADQVNHLKEKLLVPATASSRNAAAGDPSPAGPCSDGSSSTDDKTTTHGGVGVNERSSAGAPPQPPQHPPASMNNGAAVWPYSCAPSPAYFSSGIAIPIYPAALGYWGCMVPAPGAWSMPWPAVQPPPQGLSSPTSTAPSVSLSSSGADSLTLGKHPREVDKGRSSGCHGSGKVWAPKTIRIDDADEVARSSIWSLIGIKGDKQKHDADHGVRNKHGTVFEPKKAAKPVMITSSPLLLHTNPVALTRSVTFQEGS